MPRHPFASQPAEILSPLLKRHVLHTGSATVARLNLLAGAMVPEHFHPNEQITVLLEGKLRFFMQETEILLIAGEAMVIPPNVPHRVEAVVDSVAIDVFTPPRADWISGDDAYLRR